MMMSVTGVSIHAVSRLSYIKHTTHATHATHLLNSDEYIAESKLVDVVASCLSVSSSTCSV